MNRIFFSIFLILALLLSFLEAGTQITVTSQYKEEINIKIQGTGVGGCDVILKPGDVDTSDCWCLWGTINYSFCAYKKAPGDSLNVSNAVDVQQGKCPVVTGESLVCSDLSSLGNCYDYAYSCVIDAGGLCHCSTV